MEYEYLLEGFENENDENTTEQTDIDYTQLLETIIAYQQDIITETEQTNTYLLNVNQGLLQVCRLSSMIFIIIVLVIVCKYITKLF